MRKDFIQCQAETWQGRCQREAYMFWGDSYYPSPNAVGANKWLCRFHHKLKGNVLSYAELDREDLRILNYKPSSLFLDSNIPEKLVFGLVVILLSVLLAFQWVIGCLLKGVGYVKKNS